jgi:hypothetical protein
MIHPKFGDVFEIPTSKGLAYALYTHEDKKYGRLIWVFQELHAQRPTDMQELVRGEVRFCTLIARVALSNHYERVGHVDIPEAMRKFPVFRSFYHKPNTDGRMRTYWFWNGEREWREDKPYLTPEQKRYPTRAVPNHIALVEQIESGWRPEDYP